MRKKGIIILLVIIAIFAVIAFFVRDKYLEKAVEKIGETVAGAKVEVDNFHFSLLKMQCSWNRLQIADKDDPWKNIIETGKTALDIETRPLFWKRVIIKEMILENVRTGTKRTTDGSLPKKKEPPSKENEEPGMASKAKDALKKQMEELPVFDISGLGKKLKIDSLVNVDNLKSVQQYKLLTNYADSSFKYWSGQIKTDAYNKRIFDLEQKIKSLNIDKIKNVAVLAEALKKLNDIQKEVKSLKIEVEGQHKSLTKTFDDLQSKLKDAQNSAKADITKAQSLAKLKSLDVKDVSLLLFGEPVVNKAEKILNYVALGRKYLPKGKKDSEAERKEEPVRLKGQNIRFPFHYRYPEFLLRKAKLSVATAAGDTSQAYFIEGNIYGLTNEPALFKQPTTFNFDVKKISGNGYALSGSIDHTTEQYRDSLWVVADNFNFGKVELKKSKYFPNTISAKKGSINLSGFFIENNINMKLKLDAAPVNFVFQNKGSDQISKIVRDVLSGLKEVQLKAGMKGRENDYKLNMNSNIDGVLGNQVKKILDKKLRAAQKQVEDYVRSESDKQRKKAEVIIDKNKKTIYAEIDKTRNKVQEKIDEIERKKKEIEKRIEEEKKKLGNKAKDKLKGMFKKP